MVRGGIRVLVALLVLTALPAVARGAADEVAREVLDTVGARLAAYARGDAAAWGTHVDDRCLCGGETKSAIAAAILRRPAGVRVRFGDPTEIALQRHGDTVVLRYRVVETIEVEGQRRDVAQWRLETYRRTAGRWLLIAGDDKAIAPDPVAVPVSREVLARYVGRYEYTAGAVDEITLEGERLQVTPSGEAKVALSAESERRFFAPGQAWRLEFALDDAGRCVGLKFIDQGQSYAARRLP